MSLSLKSNYYVCYLQCSSCLVSTHWLYLRLLVSSLSILFILPDSIHSSKPKFTSSLKCFLVSLVPQPPSLVICHSLSSSADDYHGILFIFLKFRFCLNQVLVGSFMDPNIRYPPQKTYQNYQEINQSCREFQEVH